MNETLQYIHSRTRFGSRLGLERIRELLRRVGSPQEHLRFVHIAGTNGKGSTATYIANTLTAAGYRCGRYISPFVLNFNERISIDGTSISDDDLTWAVNILKPHVEQMDDSVTEFELVTAAAMLYYYAQGCDVISLETGLGGRFDATNVIPAPLCAVLTKISFDHMQYLGNTLEQIAFEKCGIIKSGSAVISYPFQFSEAAGVIARTAAEKGCPLYLPDNDRLEILRSDIDGSLIEYGGCACACPWPAATRSTMPSPPYARLNTLRRSAASAFRASISPKGLKIRSSRPSGSAAAGTYRTARRGPQRGRDAHAVRRAR